MKILRLKSENVMRLVAVDITPEGHLITIGGKNAAGKSSVLKSIAMALGGEKLVPDEPIRVGESEGSVEVDLGDLVVTRKFHRDKLTDDTWSDTVSTLVVSNKAGARYPSPQAMLDKLLGRLTFDPLDFANDKDRKRQVETLRALAGIDTKAIDQKRKAAYDQRAILNKTHEIKVAQLLKLPSHKDVPAIEISLADIAAELKTAEEIREQADKDAKAFISATGEVTKYEKHCADLRDVIAGLEKTLANQREALAAGEIQLQSHIVEAQAADERQRLSRASVPDMAAIRSKISHAEGVNAKVRANAAYAAAKTEAVAIQEGAAAQDALVTAADEEKRQLIEAAQFPVEGLTLTDDGVVFNGIPFSQASTAEQIRVSVAIGMALNPTLKVLLIKNGNSLDDDSMKVLADQADKDGYQIWAEVVTKHPEDVKIFIEDGEVATPAQPAVAAVTPTVLDEPFELK